MGYTHYATRTKCLGSQEQWDSFIEDFKKVLPCFEEWIERRHKSDQCLEMGDNLLKFNGIDDASHETFWLERVMDDKDELTYDLDDGTPKTHKFFMFCKTARKSYDVAVCSALIIAKKHFGNNIIVTSDGTDEEWEEARFFCHDEVGYGEDFHLPESGPDVKKGGFFNTCNSCGGEGCIECEKPCAVGCHNVEETNEHNHATGTMDWGVCTICGYGVSQMWHHEYIGEAVTDQDHPMNVIKEYY